jgi:hypothetical protein
MGGGTMKRALLIGAAALIALAAAVPLWMALDGEGERTQASLTETTKPEIIDCSALRDPEGCTELNHLLSTLNSQLAAIDERHAEVEKTQAAIEANAMYVDATEGELAELSLAALDRTLEDVSRAFTTLSNASQARHAAAKNAINNVRG